MRGRFEVAVSTLLTLAAVVIAASVALRELHSPRPDLSAGTQKPQFVTTWSNVLQHGIRLGPDTAPVTLVEFADLECPFCRTFHGILMETLRQRHGSVSLVYVAYPLDMHRFAMGAARAAECAAGAGRFINWIEAVYDKQDSLGLKTWESYATEAGIPDSFGIARCAKDSRPVARIEGGRSIGRSLGVSGTPTLMVNGWLLPGVPSKDQLIKAVNAFANGKNPYSSQR